MASDTGHLGVLAQVLGQLCQGTGVTLRTGIGQAGGYGHRLRCMRVRVATAAVSHLRPMRLVVATGAFRHQCFVVTLLRVIDVE